jgi:signal-transduction protein with cAMP-binding, CBS, and nucleotidyltransferase domain
MTITELKALLILRKENDEEINKFIENLMEENEKLKEYMSLLRELNANLHAKVLELKAEKHEAPN